MYKCEKCDRSFKNNGARASHQKFCDGEGTKLDKKKEKQKEVCPKCGLRILASKQKHYEFCDGKGPRRRQPKKGYNPWNKGQTKETNDKIKKQADLLKERFKSGELIPYWKGKKLSQDAIEKLKKKKNHGIVKRSKNEKYFAELCQEKFNNVLTNESIFNGWDADVIIEDLKVAVLWNGKWHYEKIMEGHSVEQVQNRDKIKIKEIKEKGYKPYVIKDMGRHDKDFVENEFNKFLEWVNKKLQY